jgi:transcriptional repressor NrdR
MKCPYCGEQKTRVVDSRPGRDDSDTRRRRHCGGCGRRFTTFERPGENMPLVIKRDGRLESFDRDKLLAAVKRACTKLPVAEGHLIRLVGKIETRLQQSRHRRFRSQILGDWVASALRELHPAAYIRYSMVHRQIHDVETLQKFLAEGVEEK